MYDTRPWKVDFNFGSLVKTQENRKKNSKWGSSIPAKISQNVEKIFLVATGQSLKQLLRIWKYKHEVLDAFEARDIHKGPTWNIVAGKT